MTITTEFSKYENCKLQTGSYSCDGSLALRVYNDEGPLASITTCLDIPDIKPDQAIVDTNNCPWAEEFIDTYKLGKPTNVYIQSGFCIYPLYIFDRDAIEKYKG